MIGLASGLSIGENWKKGYWVDFNTEVGYWTLLNTIAVDFYTVAWTEIDNSGKILMLELNSIIGGIPIKGSVALTRRDDPIGSQTIYYESE